MKTVFDENDWAIPENSGPYEKSKYLAEKEVWDIYEKNKDKIKIAVINPGLVIGPAFGSSMDSTSS